MALRASFVLAAALACLILAAAEDAWGAPPALRGGVEALLPKTAPLGAKPTEVEGWPFKKHHTACWRGARGRGVGELPDRGEGRKDPKCPHDKPVLSAGLCYRECEEGETGIGPVCWAQCVKPRAATELFFCCKDIDECNELVSTLAVTMPDALIKFGMDIALRPGNIIGILKDVRELVQDSLKLTLPLCEKKNDVEELEEIILGQVTSA